jgi:hypothetical protein
VFLPWERPSDPIADGAVTRDAGMGQPHVESGTRVRCF